MRRHCRHLVDLSRDLISGPGLLLHPEPKTMLQLLIFSMKVIFETRRPEKHCLVWKECGATGQEAQGPSAVTESSMLLEFKHFCSPFALS